MVWVVQLSHLVAKWSFEKEQKDNFLAYCPWNDDGRRQGRGYTL